MPTRCAARTNSIARSRTSGAVHTRRDTIDASWSTAGGEGFSRTAEVERERQLLRAWQRER